jgi:hypothetical protein
MPNPVLEKLERAYLYITLFSHLAQIPIVQHSIKHKTAHTIEINLRYYTIIKQATSPTIQPKFDYSICRIDNKQHTTTINKS